MTPKEKAKELVDKMDLKQMPSLNLARNEINLNDTFFNAKQCALIAVDEILKYQDSLVGMLDTNDGRSIMFWQEVKKEIEKL